MHWSLGVFRMSLVLHDIMIMCVQLWADLWAQVLLSCCAPLACCRFHNAEGGPTEGLHWLLEPWSQQANADDSLRSASAPAS